jgi:biopolymer transport protein ExbB
MISGIIIVACVGWLIWNFIMGNGANFEGGVNTGHLPGNMLAMVYKEVNCTSFVRIIINGCCVFI